MDLPVIPHTALTPAEVASALEANGAVDVVVTRCTPIFNDSAIVLATGKSVPHLRKLARMVAHGVKARGLTTMNPGQPIEGEFGEDGWMLVDAGSVVVHVLLPATRTKLRLEAHFERVSAQHGESPGTTVAVAPDADIADGVIGLGAAPKSSS